MRQPTASATAHGVRDELGTTKTTMSAASAAVG